jgi:Tfp pilus assembly protein PilV
MDQMRSVTAGSARALPVGRRRSAGPAGAPGGFTIIEVLVAAVLLLMIAVGILPMFTRSIVSNAEGFDHSQVANFARGRAEEFFQLPFNSPELTLLVGVDRVFDEYYSQNTRSWVDGAVPVGDNALWTRTTTIRQFSVTDLTAPLADTAPPANVHLKEITVTVQSTRSGPLGVGKAITVRHFKSQ